MEKKKNFEFFRETRNWCKKMLFGLSKIQIWASEPLKIRCPSKDVNYILTGPGVKVRVWNDESCLTSSYLTISFFFSSFEHFERIFASFSTSKLQNCNLTKIRQNLRILGQNSKKFAKVKGNREFFVMKAFWRIYGKINVKFQLLLSYELIFDDFFF